MGWDGIVDGAKKFATNPVGTVEGIFGGGDPSGDDHGSSNWAAWGHDEIRSMLDHTVDVHDVNAAADAWRDQARRTDEVITGFTQTLRGIVANGWRDASGQAAIDTLGPINKWSASVAETTDHISGLMADSSYYAGQAKATVPPAPSHNWMEWMASGVVLGPGGTIIDAVAQHQAQEQQRAEAVRIMTNVYSTPINDNQAAVPTYPKLADPTSQPPQPYPVTGPSPGSGLAGAGVPGSGGGAPGGGAHPAPATAGLQNVTGRSGFPAGGAAGPGPLGGPGQPGGAAGGAGFGGGGFGGGSGGAGVGAGAAAAAAGVPFMTPTGVGGDVERTGRGVRGAGLGGARLGGPGGRAGTGPRGEPGFGPKGSAAAAAAEAAEGRMGASAGRGGAGGAGGAPMAGAGGQGRDEDKEHRRPSYLIEMDDVFSDGRKVAPPVIGEDPPDYYG